MRKKKIPILRLNYSKKEKINISAEIKKILSSGNLSMSKNVFQFEKHDAGSGAGTADWVKTA